ncbi:MAG TPA: hypothetical protein VL574_01465, partial [Stellaceae bacterium]|nr:hypothetical protein [Stellaceae bacterium]
MAERPVSDLIERMTAIALPTPETPADATPEVERTGVRGPPDSKTVFLAGLFVMALLTIAYFAAEVMLPL